MSRNNLYFMEQKILGGVLVILSVIVALISNNDGLIPLLIAPLGIYMIATKEMILVNKYYIQRVRECEAVTCPECGGETFVVDSRPKTDHVVRRRECKGCGKRFSTYEIDKEFYDRVVKGMIKHE